MTRYGEINALLRAAEATMARGGEVPTEVRAIVAEGEHIQGIAQLFAAAFTSQNKGDPAATPPDWLLERMREDPESVQRFQECEDCGLQLQPREAEACCSCGGLIGPAFYTYKRRFSTEQLRREIAAARRMGGNSHADRMQAMLDRKLAEVEPPAAAEYGEAIAAYDRELKASQDRIMEAAEALSARVTREG